MSFGDSRCETLPQLQRDAALPVSPRAEGETRWGSRKRSGAGRGLKPDRLRFPRHPLGPERRLRHHRLHPGKRREVLSLPDDDPVYSIGRAFAGFARELTEAFVKILHTDPQSAPIGARHHGRVLPQAYPGPLMKRCAARVLESVFAANRTDAGTHDWD